MSGIDKRTLALGIKSCLDSLQNDAEGAQMEDLARFIGLAALAAEEAALTDDGSSTLASAFMLTSAGHC